MPVFEKDRPVTVKSYESSLFVHTTKEENPTNATLPNHLRQRTGGIRFLLSEVAIKGGKWNHFPLNYNFGDGYTDLEGTYVTAEDNQNSIIHTIYIIAPDGCVDIESVRRRKNGVFAEYTDQDSALISAPKFKPFGFQAIVTLEPSPVLRYVEVRPMGSYIPTKSIAVPKELLPFKFTVDFE